MNRWHFVWQQLNRKLWLRAGLYGLFGVAVALAAGGARPFVPRVFAERFGGQSVEEILTILASSMLAVATFSLGVLVTAYTSVSSMATPRVAELVIEDEATQKVQATFVGAFLYSIVGVTAVNAGYYGPESRAVVFVFSLLVVGLVAYRFLIWVSRLSNLARVDHMIELVERRTLEAMRDQLDEPYFGGRAGRLDDGFEILSDRAGYVRNVDANHLQHTAEDFDCDVEIVVPPGHLVFVGEVLARVSRTDTGPETSAKFRESFQIGPARSFDQDPRFGLVVLGEISAKALSPGINDPGTAVQVIAAGLRLMAAWSQACDAQPTGRRPRILARDFVEADLLDDVFGPSMRYGEHDLIIAVRLQKALRSLSRVSGSVGTAATLMAEEALARSSRALPEGPDRARLLASAI